MRELCNHCNRSNCCSIYLNCSGMLRVLLKKKKRCSEGRFSKAFQTVSCVVMMRCVLPILMYNEKPRKCYSLVFLKSFWSCQSSTAVSHMFLSRICFSFFFFCWLHGYCLTPSIVVWLLCQGPQHSLENDCITLPLVYLDR